MGLGERVGKCQLILSLFTLLETFELTFAHCFVSNLKSHILPNLNLLLSNLTLHLPNPGPILDVGGSKQVETICCPGMISFLPDRAFGHGL